MIDGLVILLMALTGVITAGVIYLDGSNPDPKPSNWKPLPPRTGPK